MSFKKISRFIYGVDIFLKEEFCEDNLNVFNSLEHLPNIQFDYILMMDVIEHIEDDIEYLKLLNKRFMKEDTIILITVPAFMSLYSLHDKELKHFRRYNHKQLKKLITNCGLKEMKWTYFYFSLIIGRLLTFNKTENCSMWTKDEKSFSTRFVEWVLNTDYNICRFFSKIGIHIPGLSLMSICKINNTDKKS